MGRSLTGSDHSRSDFWGSSSDVPRGHEGQGQRWHRDLGVRGTEAGGIWPQEMEMSGTTEPRGMLGVRDRGVNGVSKRLGPVRDKGEQTRGTD